MSNFFERSQVIEQADDAGKFRRTFVDFYQSFEKDLDPGTAARLTLIAGGRDIAMTLSRVSSDKIGFVYFSGRDADGRPVDVGMYHSSVVYLLDTVPSDKPQSVGFGIDAGQRSAPAEPST